MLEGFFHQFALFGAEFGLFENPLLKLREDGGHLGEFFSGGGLRVRPHLLHGRKFIRKIAFLISLVHPGIESFGFRKGLVGRRLSNLILLTFEGFDRSEKFRIGNRSLLTPTSSVRTTHRTTGRLRGGGWSLGGVLSGQFPSNIFLSIIGIP